MSAFKMACDTTETFEIFPGREIDGEIYGHVPVRGPLKGFTAIRRGYRQIAVLDPYFGHMEEKDGPDEKEADSKDTESLPPVPLAWTEGDGIGFEDENESESQQEQKRSAELG